MPIEFDDDGNPIGGTSEPSAIVVPRFWRTKTGVNAMNDPVAIDGDGKPVPLVGIDVEIRAIEGSKGLYKESWQQNGNTTTIICVVPGDWTIRRRFLKDMLGFTIAHRFPDVEGNAVEPVLCRYLPERNPVAPWEFCVSCDLIDAYGNHRQESSLSNWPRYDWLVYACVFQAVPYTILPNPTPNALYVGGNPETIYGSPVPFDEMTRYVYWKRRWNSREQKIPGGGFKLVGAVPPVSLGEVGFRPSTEIEYQATWYQIPVDSMPSDAIADCVGHVNEAPLTIDNKEYAAETALFKGAEEEKYFTASGDFVCDMKYLFGIREETWNFFPSRTGVPVLVTSDGTSTGDKLYTTRDFTALFKGQ